MTVKRSIDDVLRAVSDVLFPGEEGEVVVTLKSRSSEGDTALHVMAWRRDVEGAQLLVAAGADVNAIGDMDQTPLHVAIMQEDIPMIRLVLVAGAGVSFRSEFGKTALEEAVDKGGAIQEMVRRHAST
jgi:ankyrin repeat protein